MIVPRRAWAPVADVAANWRKANPAERPSSIARDRTIIDRHLSPALGKRPIGSITKADVQALVDSWKGALAPSTVGRQYACLRAIFAYAEADERIVHTPCRGIRLPQVHLVGRQELSADDLGDVADALGSEWAPMMWLGAVMGLRWGEAAGLAVRHLDPLVATIAVDQQLTRQGVLTAPKFSTGTDPMRAPTSLVDMRAAHLARRGLTGADTDTLVCTTSDGTPLDDTNWRRVWRPACAKAGHPQLGFDDLRSTCATELIAATVDVTSAQRRLRHSSVHETPALHARATADADRKAAESIGRRLGPRDARTMARKSRGRPKTLNSA